MKKFVTVIMMIVALTAGVRGFAQDKAYQDGSVWAVSLIKTEANMGDEYLKSLKNNWIAVHEEALKQGLILSYKVLAGAASNPDDFDIMLLVEYKNMASMEGNDDKWEAISKKVIGDNNAMQQLNQTRVNMRTIYGEKLLREELFK
jgi:hypothetical protein